MLFLSWEEFACDGRKKKKEISEEINPLSQQEQWLREREQQLAQREAELKEEGGVPRADDREGTCL